MSRLKYWQELKANMVKSSRSDYTKVLNFGSQMPSAQIIGEGSIVVDNNGASVPIKTVGLHQIKVEVHKIFQNPMYYTFSRMEV
jgi:uncharacterized protein YfaS (alpha-2-macroglobulin family)